MFEGLKRLLNSRHFELAITVLIIVNAITLGLETWPAAEERFGFLFHFLDKSILVVFVVEIGLRLSLRGWRFFYRPLVDL